MGTTVTGLSIPIRVPTTGDVFDVPGDMLKTTTDLVNAAKAIDTKYVAQLGGLCVQAWSAVVTFDGNGICYVTYPKPFSSPPMVSAISGAKPGTNAVQVYSINGPQKTTAQVGIFGNWVDPSASKVVGGPYRIDLIAVGLV